MTDVIVKNTTIEDLRIQDLYGIGVEAGLSTNLSEMFSYTQITASNELKELLASGTLSLIQENGQPLPLEEGIDYVEAVSMYTLVSGLSTKANVDHPHSFIELEDTPDDYVENKYLKTTTSGIILTEAPSSSFPPGGGKGHSLVKLTDDDGNVTWEKRTTEEFAIAMSLALGGNWV